jgi:flagellar basal-body rod modification protein FlgD
MAAQLAQFSGLEQMQNMNTTLTDIQKGQKPVENFQALNFIGKAVSGDSAKVMRMKGDKEHEFTFTLPENAKDADIKVRNQEGEVIRSVSLHDLKKGDNRWVWNGKNENGNSVPVGEYQFAIEAKGSNDKKMYVKTDFSGLISGVSYGAEGPVLMVGTQTIKLKDVKRIIDPSLKNNDQKSASVPAPDLKTGQAAVETDDKGAEEAPLLPTNLMTGVGLSGGMMEKLKRETSPTPGPVLKPETKAPKAGSSSEASSGAPAAGKKPTIKGPIPSTNT